MIRPVANHADGDVNVEVHLLGTPGLGLRRSHLCRSLGRERGGKKEEGADLYTRAPRWQPRAEKFRSATSAHPSSGVKFATMICLVDYECLVLRIQVQYNGGQLSGMEAFPRVSRLRLRWDPPPFSLPW